VFRNAAAMVTEKEKIQIQQLVEELAKLCNKKLPHILKRLELDELKKFEVTVNAVSLQFACSEDTYKELISRDHGQDDTNITYFG
jgi:hypothetical protein